MSDVRLNVQSRDAYWATCSLCEWESEPTLDQEAAEKERVEHYATHKELQTPIIFRRRPGMDMRRFIVWRPDPPADYKRDGLTNAGKMPDIEGVVFSDGTVAIRWMVQDRQSTAIWAKFETFEAVHGHPEYGTRIEWIDA